MVRNMADDVHGKTAQAKEACVRQGGTEVGSPRRHSDGGGAAGRRRPGRARRLAVPEPGPASSCGTTVGATSDVIAGLTQPARRSGSSQAPGAGAGNEGRGSAVVPGMVA